MAASVLVPDSISRNGEIFRNSPRRENPSKTTSRYVEGVVEQQGRAGGGGAAMARADMSEDDGMGSIDPPALLLPASYYQDVRNHANIASTMLVSARRTVGFEPSLVGQQLSEQQMNDFITKFNRWLMELDNYWPYIDIRSSQTRALWFQSADEDVSRFIASFGGLSAEVEQAWRQSLSGMVRAASSAAEGGSVKGVSFQTDILDTSGSRDPRLPLTFGRSAQSVVGGRYDSVLTTGASYLVDSSAIIADADYLARNGVAIFGAREYCDYVNSGGR